LSVFRHESIKHHERRRSASAKLGYGPRSVGALKSRINKGSVHAYPPPAPTLTIPLPSEQIVQLECPLM
jgi:hypothetical protein